MEDVYQNRGTPKSSILIGFSITVSINHPFWGTRIFGNTHMLKYVRFWKGQASNSFFFQISSRCLPVSHLGHDLFSHDFCLTNHQTSKPLVRRGEAPPGLGCAQWTGEAKRRGKTGQLADLCSPWLVGNTPKRSKKVVPFFRWYGAIMNRSTIQNFGL